MANTIRLQQNNDLLYLVGICILLSTFGLIFIYSASSVFALEKYGAPTYFVKKQLGGLLIALLAALCARYIPIYLIRRISPLLFWIALGLTSITLFSKKAVTIHGSSRWLSLGPLTFQPSELLKVFFILYLADLLTCHEYDFATKKSKFWSALTIIAITAMVLLRQPDFGMATTMAITGLILLFIMNIQNKLLFFTCLATLPAGLLLVIFKPYRMRRVLTFLDPWKDPQGAGFQIIQSLIAIGSGGWFGLGIGASKQKFFYLPMQHTDFIFSIIAEETGFFGAAIIISLYVTLLFLGFRIAWRQPDSFGSIMTIGFVVIISLQALIHLCVATGLVPPKGVGLPLISYGKSSLVSIFIMIGLILNSSKHRS